MKKINWIYFTALFTLAHSMSAHAKPYPVASHINRQIGSIEKKSKALLEKTHEEAQRTSSRLHHAKELLGKYYKDSVVKASEGIVDVDQFLLTWTTKELKGYWKRFAKQISKAIIQESEKHSFDPIFLMAVIENESSFNPTVRGSHGEIGLMQLTPDTAKWVCEKYGLPWKGVNSLKDPVVNIKIGSAYLSYLREKFGFHSQLYLAAYNMGSTNVKRALGKQIWPKVYPSRVMQRYVRYYSELTGESDTSIN